MDLSSSDSSSSSSESDEYSEDSIDWQFVEEARQRQRWKERQELESDSELSELASSAFHGMEGIEVSSGTAIRQDQDQDQDQGQGQGQDQGQSQDDEEMGDVAPTDIGDVEVPGGASEDVGGDSEVQAPIFSPRKTRSGRVRK
jgi:hypothetical protein